MRRMAVFAIVASLLFAGAWTWAQEAQKMPTPQKEHEWLKQFAGEWETEADLFMEPGKPPVKSKGYESSRLLGGFWLISDIKADFQGTPMTGIMTVGYDTIKKKYVGSWVCNICDTLFIYEGSAKGQTLSLETEGPDPTDPSKTCKMRDVVELKGKDLKVITSTMQNPDGSWITIMNMTARRKK